MSNLDTTTPPAERCNERDAMGWACRQHGIAHQHLVTIECSRPGDAYTLFSSGPTLDVHLAGRGEHGGTGPCLCGFDRHARAEDGRSLIGFSVGGGVTGPSFTHVPCEECAAAAGDAHITGTHAAMFAEVSR
ncbi:hypothetical protein [Cellulomonas sp. C5510]|uniref:hypothetical protein n=1 Tax=Cellulomonas sp. C5510 TaxID=2871170 RepID=UPI001C93E502|nr:hypothetical protein [Cellulomonas sp. C5510]QZN86916.1 hypothetical protein K5O09_07335 [Cellulomonas sp. C5510]